MQAQSLLRVHFSITCVTPTRQGPPPGPISPEETCSRTSQGTRIPMLCGPHYAISILRGGAGPSPSTWMSSGKWIRCSRLAHTLSQSTQKDYPRLLRNTDQTISLSSRLMASGMRLKRVHMSWRMVWMINCIEKDATGIYTSSPLKTSGPKLVTRRPSFCQHPKTRSGLWTMPPECPLNTTTALIPLSRKERPKHSG